MLAPPARAPRRAVVALSEDPQLLEALAGVPATVTEIILCSAVDRFAEQLVAEACGVALIDAAGVVDPIAFIVGLRRQFPELVFVVAGGGHLQAPLTALLADGSVFRFVHKPASAQRLQLFLEAAVRRHEEASELESSRRIAALRAPTGRPGVSRWWLAAGALAAAGAVTLLVISLHRPHVAAGSARTPSPAERPAATAAGLAASPAPSAAALATAPTAPAADAGVPADAVLLQLLANADRALAQNRLVAADGTGAGDLYRAALQRAPGNARALHGLDGVTALLLDGAERNLAAGQNDDAARRVAGVLRLQPDNVRAATLSVQLSQQRESELREQLQRSANGAKASQALVYLQLARRRMDSGALFQPIDDSASTYLEAARTLAPDDPGVRALSVELDRRLATVRQARAPRSAVPASAPASTPAPQTVYPEPAAAAAAAIPSAPEAVTAGSADVTDDSVAASSLERDRFVPPQYPKAALARGITGWVDLEFTVTTAGAVTDIAITGAQPRDTFNDAALAAISQWHFRPIVRNGVPVEQRAHVRMRFSL
jgi:protein TonB